MTTPFGLGPQPESMNRIGPQPEAIPDFGVSAKELHHLDRLHLQVKAGAVIS